MPRITKGLYTLGDKLQQHVAVTDHSVCRARAIVVSETWWGDTSQQQIASCVLENFCENLFPQQNFVAATSRKNQIRLKLCDLLRRQIPVAATKIFTKILQCKRSVLSLQCVSATCCCNLSPSAYRPYPGFYLAMSFTLYHSAAQLCSITEVAPKSSFSSVNRNPIQYGFRASAKAMRYSINTYQIC